MSPAFTDNLLNCTTAKSCATSDGRLLSKTIFWQIKCKLPNGSQQYCSFVKKPSWGFKGHYASQVSGCNEFATAMSNLHIWNSSIEKDIGSRRLDAVFSDRVNTSVIKFIPPPLANLHLENKSDKSYVISKSKCIQIYNFNSK
ncbi:hypothetical protein SLA2020_386400 [Shorea laevis]